MNNFYYLTHDDFYVDPNGMKGPVLCCNVEGICVALFHADQGKCMHCEEAIPEFKKLPRMFLETSLRIEKRHKCKTYHDRHYVEV